MNLTMGEYVVMPNHLHAIIGIGKNKYNSPGDGNHDKQKFVERAGRDAMHCAITPGNKPKSRSPKNQFGPQSKNLASIIRGFKIGMTINARLINPDFGWQSRFYDSIIRNDQSLKRITNYIKKKSGPF